MKLPNDYVTVIVRPSTRGKTHPLTAFLAGTQIEGCGTTVFGAIEDLFTSDKAGEVCRQLEKAVAKYLDSSMRNAVFGVDAERGSRDNEATHSSDKTPERA